MDDQRLLGVVDRERSARRAARTWRHVAVAASRREPVQDRADELHQGGFARFVLAVKDDERFRKPADLQPAPNTKTIDPQLSDFHA